MTNSNLAVFKILIFGAIVVFAGFIGFMLIDEPTTINTDDQSTADIECPPSNQVVCRANDPIDGITACFREGDPADYFCCPPGSGPSGNSCVPNDGVEVLPTCASIGSSLTCLANLQDAITCTQAGSMAVVNCCRPGQTVVNNRCTNPAGNVPEGGACTPYDNVIECTSGICCDCGVCGGVQETCTDLCTPDPVNPTPTNPTPTNPNPNPTNPDPTPNPTNPNNGGQTPTPNPTNPNNGDGDTATNPDNTNGETVGENTNVNNNNNNSTNTVAGSGNLPATAINLEKDHYILMYGFVLIFYGLTIRVLIKRLRE